MDRIQRKEWTTRDADPTVVVEWTIWLTNGRIRCQEFQNVYRGWHVTYDVEADLTEQTAEHIHKALEDKWQNERQR